MPNKTLRDALKVAQKDPSFAVDLVQNPKKYTDEYNLTGAQIKSLSQGKAVMKEALKSGKLPRGPVVSGGAGAGSPYS